MKTKMLPWFAVAGVMLTVVWLNSPAQIPVIGYKLALLTTAACLAHLLDNTFFRDSSDSVSEIARAIVFAAVVIGMTMGL